MGRRVHGRITDDSKGKKERIIYPKKRWGRSNGLNVTNESASTLIKLF